MSIVGTVSSEMSQRQIPDLEFLHKKLQDASEFINRFNGELILIGEYCQLFVTFF